MSDNNKLNQNQLQETSYFNNPENETPQKSSIFDKILSLFKREEDLDINPDDLKKDSRFSDYLFLVDETENKEDVLEAIDICDDNLKLSRHRAYLEKKKKSYKSTLEDLECYNNLSEQDSKVLKNLINKFIHLNTERTSIRYQFGDFNNSIDKLSDLEEDAYDSILQIENAEKQKRLLKRDIELIKSEKERTISDRDKLTFAYTFIHKFSVALAFIFGISLIFLTLVYTATKQSLFFPLSILCFTVILTITLIYVFRRKIIFELKLNEKKQAKIIALLNKKIVVFSYYANFLDYAYKKYKVKNSRVLKENLSDFENYKNMTNRYDNLSKIFYEVKTQLEDFLFKNNINMNKISLESFAKSINIDNKISYYKNMEQKINNVTERIKNIDKKQGELFDRLIHLNSVDETNEKVIEKLMKSYLIESEKIIFDEENEEAENNFYSEQENSIDKINEDE